MSTQNNIREVLEGHSQIPVITFDQSSEPIDFMQHLNSLGVNCIEITLRTPEGITAIETLKKHFGDKFLVGAGTVTNSEQIQKLKNIGADFLVSPGLTNNLKVEMEKSTLPYLPGCSTPSEIMKAMEMGLDTLKFFPANLFGGKGALKTYSNLFPTIKFCPTGGITENTYEEYLALKNVIAVGGSWFQANYNTNKK